MWSLSLFIRWAQLSFWPPVCRFCLWCFFFLAVDRKTHCMIIKLTNLVWTQCCFYVSVWACSLLSVWFTNSNLNRIVSKGSWFHLREIEAGLWNNCSVLLLLYDDEWARGRRSDGLFQLSNGHSLFHCPVTVRPSPPRPPPAGGDESCGGALLVQEKNHGFWYNRMKRTRRRWSKTLRKGHALDRYIL